MSNLPSSDMETFRKTLWESKHIIAVAGAGLSAASGIGTFRGAGGLWRKYDAMSLATPEAFNNNPSRVWQFYHYRREKALNAPTNNAHIALAKFSLGSIRQNLAPESTFTLITQNVDGLSQWALDQVKASEPSESRRAQPEILEMHGRLFDVVCTRCNHREPNFSSPICEALRGTENLIEYGQEEPDIPLQDLPKCSKCGSLARPGVVWFGERPLYLTPIDILVDQADLCIVIGTSSTVYPAAGYAARVHNHGGKVAAFNLERSVGDENADFFFLGPCEITLPKALSLAS
ncbi:DHS-like NAD/FAD-binding domain-containing protein [Irpex rosettiformis]|uniref:DHS-like NAD/FAD-binding domain-containing protein n=1 Tax=Irpex rosettiformis TaxID=378272 RepID=A0ACB8UEM4_9APHY|nr:DHS-like NAD/FAD-binding domain-containing protein [Irpex rosettiformis]